MNEPLTPVDIESALHRVITEMTQAQQALAKARTAETTARVTFKRAEAATFHRTDCPQPKRGEVTVGDRDAWVARQVMDDWEAAEIATTVREVAQDNLRVILAKAETYRSLGASVRTAYSLAGHS